MRPNLALAFFALALALSLPAFAQENAGGAAQPDQALADAAKKAYKAVVDNNPDLFKTVTQGRFAHAVKNDTLRPAPTGPKVDVSWDGNVKVLRQSAKDAVVTANVFKPQSSDIPASEVSRLDLYMRKNRKGEWVVSAPDKKEAQPDADNGGWYHSAAFTLCPNKGVVFVPNHFSSKTECTATAVCR